MNIDGFLLYCRFQNFPWKEEHVTEKNGLHGVISIVGVLIPSYSALNAIITKQRLDQYWLIA